MTLTPLQREVETEPACSRCKRPISRLGDLYRCASCDAVFHRPCIYEHFGWSVNGEPHPSPRPTHGSPRGYAAVPIRGDVRHDVALRAAIAAAEDRGHTLSERDHEMIAAALAGLPLARSDWTAALASATPSPRPDPDLAAALQSLAAVDLDRADELANIRDATNTILGSVARLAALRDSKPDEATNG